MAERPGFTRRGVPAHSGRGGRVAERSPDLPGRPEARRWWPIATPIAALLIGASLLLPTARHQWALAIFHQPTRYTVLSFNDSSALPSVVRRDTAIPISFTIGNYQGKAEAYRYVLTERAGDFANQLGTSQRIIPSGGTWSVRTVVRPTCRLSPCKIEVVLPGRQETIDFLVTLTAPS